MKVTTTAIVLVALTRSCLIAGADAIHSKCYHYFLQKDKCVHYAQDPNETCKDQVKGPTHHLQGVLSYSPTPRLARRYDNNEKAGVVGKVDKAHIHWRCPEPKAKDPRDGSWNYGVCLWAGTDHTGSTGWLDDNFQHNCGKKVYVQRRGQPESVKFARIVGSCLFGDVTETQGCYNIAIGPHLFNALAPTKQERDSNSIDELSWDFSNTNQKEPENGAA